MRFVLLVTVVWFLGGSRQILHDRNKQRGIMKQTKQMGSKIYVGKSKGKAGGEAS